MESRDWSSDVCSSDLSLAISHDVTVTREREVVVVEVEDQPGVLADLTRKIGKAGVNIDLVYVATSGGPGTTTTVPSWLVYQNAFSTGKVGLAAAVAVVLTVIIFVVAFAITRLVDRDPSR